MAKAVVLECEDCGRKFLSTGEYKCIMCEADSNESDEESREEG
jgi:DNA-directed RNA polymerase subunit RPC12/RpoP